MYSIKKQSSGFTIIELISTVLILGVLAVLAYGSYSQYIEETEFDQAIKDISVISLQIDAYALNNNGNYPSSLADVNLNNYLDPWGNAYRYLNIAITNGNSLSRRDGPLVPINNDYDVYSVGPDGATVTSIRPPQSLDDVVRGRNGGFIGKAEDF